MARRRSASLRLPPLLGPGDPVRIAASILTSLADHGRLGGLRRLHPPERIQRDLRDMDGGEVYVQRNEPLRFCEAF